MDDHLSSLPCSRRHFHQLAIGSLAAVMTGCGTLMYPERRGQGRSGRIDWTVAGMDAIGLVLFFVPGVIAFAVDYYNGTLFYPADSGATGDANRLRTLRFTHSRPSTDEIAGKVSLLVGRPITFTDESCVTRSLESVDQFWTTRDCLIAQIERGEIIVRCQSN